MPIRFVWHRRFSFRIYITKKEAVLKVKFFPFFELMFNFKNEKRWQEGKAEANYPKKNGHRIWLNTKDKKLFFDSIKQIMNFKRFMLRGIKQVNIEIGLITMAHNLKKYSLDISLNNQKLIYQFKSQKQTKIYCHQIIKKIALKKAV